MNHPKSFFIILILLVRIIFISATIQAAELIPAPQFIQYKKFNLKIDKNWVIVGTSQQQDKFAARWLKKHIKTRHHTNLRIVNFAEASKNKRIILGNLQEHDWLASLLEEKNIKIPSYLGKEGYVLETFNSKRQEIIIAANAPNGVFYGIQTLLKLIGKNNSIKGVSITDFPDHRIRGINTSYLSFFNRSYPPEFSQATRNKIDSFAKIKINAFCLADEYNGNFFKNSPKYIKPYKEMVEYCRERFIEFIPTIGSLRNIRGLPFELFEGWCIKDEKFKFGKDDLAAPEKPMINLLDNSEFAIDNNNDDKPDGWKITGSATIDSRVKCAGKKSLKINSGCVYVDIPAEPNKHYYLTAYAKGAYPVIRIYGINKSGKGIINQFDYHKKPTEKWRKLGVIIKTGETTTKVRCKFYGKQGSVWIADAKLYRLDCGLKNIIRTNTTDIKVTNLAKTIVYQEGTDYSVIDGEINNKFDENLKSFQIKRLVKGTIAEKQEVLVSYDSVLFWALSRYYNQPPCVADERIYTTHYYPAIDRVVKYLKPKIIHFASDEIRGFNRDSRSKKKGLTNAQLFAEWINKINSYVKQKDPNCRVMIWDDMVSPYHNGGIKDYQVRYGGISGKMAKAVENDMIDKDVIMDIWWYGDSRLTAMVAASDYFMSKGFDYVGSPWYDPENIQSWSEILFNRPGALGGFDTNWGGRPPSVQYAKQYQQVPDFADHFWNTRSEVIYFDSFEKDINNDGVPDGWFFSNSLSSPKNIIDNSCLYKNEASTFFVDGKNVQGKRYAGFPNCAISVQGELKTFYSDFIQIEPNQKFIFSGYFKKNKPGGNENFIFKFVWYDAKKQYVAEEKKMVPVISVHYKCIETEIMALENAHYLRIHLQGPKGSNEYFWIDSIRLKKISHYYQDKNFNIKF